MIPMQYSACEGGHMDIAVMLIEKYGASLTAEDKVIVRSDDGYMRIQLLS